MKEKILIIFIILCSLISGGMGAAGFLYFSGSTYTSLEMKEEEPNMQNTITKEITTEKVSIKNLESRITDTVKESSESIVSIIISKDLVVYRSDPWGFFQTPQGSVSRKVGGGSGFFIKEDGTILTNKHVVRDSDAEYTVILSDGSEYDAKVLALDPINDLAVIKISDDDRVFSPLPIASSNENLSIGQFTIAVGNALAEFQNSVSLGILSGKNRSIEAQGEKLTGLLQTDAAINPGNSGGPLLNILGEVIGINTAIAAGGNGVGFSFALSEDRIDYILESIEENGRIMRPFIGINYIPNSPGIASKLDLPVDYGIYIIDEDQSVVPGSSASKAGLEPGDILLSVNGKKLTGNVITQIIQNSLPGTTLNMKVLKKSGEKVTIDLVLGEY